MGRKIYRGIKIKIFIKMLGEGDKTKDLTVFVLKTFKFL